MHSARGKDILKYEREEKEKGKTKNGGGGGQGKEREHARGRADQGGMELKASRRRDLGEKVGGERWGEEIRR